MKTSTKVFITLGIFLLIILSCGLCCLMSWLFLASISSNSTSSDYNEKVILKPKSGSVDKIVVIDITGEIISAENGGSATGTASPDKINKELDTANDDSNVKAIILKMNTPGGTDIDSQKICEKVKSVKSNKPVVTFIESMGASGGYYVASCSDYIVTLKQAITGSIGVKIVSYDISGLLDKVGIKEKTLTNTKGVLKSGDDFYQSGSETEKIYKTLLDDSYDEFINVVVDGRKDKEKNLTREQIIKLADGRIYSGKQAVDNGLADKLGNLSDTISYIKSKYNISDNAGVFEYKQVALFGGLFDTLANQIFPGYEESKLASQISKSFTPGVKTMYMYDF
jgi:protease IV